MRKKMWINKWNEKCTSSNVQINKISMRNTIINPEKSTVIIKYLLYTEAKKMGTKQCSLSRNIDIPYIMVCTVYKYFMLRTARTAQSVHHE